jgi:hypothetical protein
MLSTLRPLLIPLTMVLLLSLSDCIRFGSDLIEDEIGSSPEPTETPSPTETPTPEATPGASTTPTPETSPTPTPEPEETPTPVPQLTEDEVESLLLNTRDLPVGWTTVSVADPFTSVPGAEDVDGILASAFFQRSELGPYLVHMLLYTDTAEDAITAFEVIETELDGADILHDVTDQVRSWETEPSSFTQLGDETFAFKAIGDTGLIPVEADMVATRKGQFVSFIIHAELMTVDTVQTEEFAETAVDRLPDAQPDATDIMRSARLAWETAMSLARNDGNTTTSN